MVRRRKNTLGQAATLTGKLWDCWRQHLLRTSPTWLWVAVTLTHILCARITEVLSLKASDFNWKANCVTIRALKRQPEASGDTKVHSVYYLIYLNLF